MIPQKPHAVDWEVLSLDSRQILLQILVQTNWFYPKLHYYSLPNIVLPLLPILRAARIGTISMATKTATVAIPQMLSLSVKDGLDSTVSAAGSQADGLDQYLGYDNVHWYVGNAKQAATFYITRMGFKRIAYRGLETGSRAVASHVIRNGGVTFILTSPLNAPKTKIADISQEEQELLEEIHVHLEQHGDAVRDVAFQVDNVDAVYHAAIKNGAHSVYAPKELSDDFGSVRYARIRTYGDTTHTLVERGNYNGSFLPGFRTVDEEDKANKYLPEVRLSHIDHCVGNQDWDEMESVCD